MTVSRYDLCKLYLEFNEKYFGNNLPNNISLEVSNRLNKCVGRYRCLHNKYTNKITPVGITISGKINWDLKSLSETLLHEMIHLHESLTDQYYASRDAHGQRFIAQAQRIKEINPDMEIVKTFEKSEQYIGGTYLVFIERENGTRSYIPCTKGYKRKIVSDLLKYGIGITKLFAVYANYSDIGGYVKECRVANKSYKDNNNLWDKYYSDTNKTEWYL